MNDFEAIGGGVLIGGGVFFILGIFTMNSEFMVTANILIIIGLNIVMNVKKFFQFLIQKDKIKGTVAFFAGIVLVFLKYAIFGIIAELVGAYWLFGGFIPMLFSLLSKVPILSLIIPKKSESLE